MCARETVQLQLFLYMWGLLVIASSSVFLRSLQGFKKSFSNVAVRIPLFWFRQKCKYFTCKCKLRGSETKRDTCRIHLQAEENGSKKRLFTTILKIEGRGKLHYLVINKCQSFGLIFFGFFECTKLFQWLRHSMFGYFRCQNEERSSLNLESFINYDLHQLKSSVFYPTKNSVVFWNVSYKVWPSDHPRIRLYSLQNN